MAEIYLTKAANQKQLFQINFYVKFNDKAGIKEMLLQSAR